VHLVLIRFYYRAVVVGPNDLEEADFTVVKENLTEGFKPHELLGDRTIVHYRKASDHHNRRKPRRISPNTEGVLCQKIDRPQESQIRLNCL
jgi:hypothetical protein